MAEDGTGRVTNSEHSGFFIYLTAFVLSSS